MSRPGDICARCGHTSGVHLARADAEHAVCFVVGCACGCFMTHDELRAVARAASGRNLHALAARQPVDASTLLESVARLMEKACEGWDQGMPSALVMQYVKSAADVLRSMTRRQAQEKSHGST